MLVYGGLLVLTDLVCSSGARRGFVPQQDQGRIYRQRPIARFGVAAADAGGHGARSKRSPVKTPGVAHTITDLGHLVPAAGQRPELRLDVHRARSVREAATPRPERPTRSWPACADVWRARDQGRQVSRLPRPPIPGLSVAGGFKLMVEDRGGLGLDALQQQTDALVAQAARTARPGRRLHPVPLEHAAALTWTSIAARSPRWASRCNDVDQTLGIYLGSLYVNNFNVFGRYWQVNLRPKGSSATASSDINLLQVRNNRGQMVPLGTLVTLREIGGPIFVKRYNLYTAAPITGNLRPASAPATSIDDDRRAAPRHVAAHR